MRRIAVTSATLDPTYAFFAPLTALAWRRVGFEALVYLVGAEAEWLADRRGALALGAARRFAEVIFVPRCAGAADSTLSQVVRLCAPDGSGDDYLLASDVDLWPLGRGWLERADPQREFHVFNADAYGIDPPRFPMCYLAGRRAAWRAAFGGGALAEQLARIPWHADGDWHFDERFATARLRALPGFEHRCQLLPRIPSSRLDRAAWDCPASLEGLVDAHLPRPGFVEPHWGEIEALLRQLLQPEDLAWAIAYRAQYVGDLAERGDPLEPWFRRWFREFQRLAPEPYRSYGGYGDGEPNGTACSLEAIRAFAHRVADPGATILNAGAGASSFLLRRMFRNVVCVDADARYLDLVRRICLENGLGGEGFVVGLESAPEADYTFYDYGEIDERGRFGHCALAWRKTRKAIYFDDVDDRPHAFPHYRRLVLDFLGARGAVAEDCRDACDRYGRWGVFAQRPALDPRGIVSFSLWGRDPLYGRGALANLRLAGIHYPGWRVRIYTDDPSLLEGACEPGVPLEVVRMPANTGVRGMFWRFLAASDEGAQAILFRDCDSRLNAREAAAVSDWLASGHRFHVMHDHAEHASWPMLGGMWGVRGGVIQDMERRLAAWGAFGAKLDDMRFLAERVWPEARLDLSHHTSVAVPHAAGAPFPPHPPFAGFVGQIVPPEG
jgi:hypothetical protein